MFGKIEVQLLTTVMRKMIRASGKVEFDTFVDNPTHTCLPQYGLRVREFYNRSWNVVASISFHTELARATAVKTIEKVYLTRVMHKLPVPVDKPLEV